MVSRRVPALITTIFVSFTRLLFHNVCRTYGSGCIKEACINNYCFYFFSNLQELHEKEIKSAQAAHEGVLAQQEGASAEVLEELKASTDAAIKVLEASVEEVCFPHNPFSPTIVNPHTKASATVH